MQVKVASTGNELVPSFNQREHRTAIQRELYLGNQREHQTDTQRELIKELLLCIKTSKDLTPHLNYVDLLALNRRLGKMDRSSW